MTRRPCKKERSSIWKSRTCHVRAAKLSCLVFNTKTNWSFSLFSLLLPPVQRSSSTTSWVTAWLSKRRWDYLRLPFLVLFFFLSFAAWCSPRCKTTAQQKIGCHIPRHVRLAALCRSVSLMWDVVTESHWKEKSKNLSTGVKTWAV